jgi:probable phosphoglycerate mutase
VIASPLLRCTATAKVAADRLNLRLERDDRLIEIAHGTWEGRLRDEIAANDPQRYHEWRHEPSRVAFEDGETIARVMSRWRDFAASLAHSGREAQPSQHDVPVLVVTHDAVVRVAIVDALGADIAAFWQPRVENGAYATFDVIDDRWMLVEECNAVHLGALRAPIDTQAL